MPTRDDIRAWLRGEEVEGLPSRKAKLFKCSNCGLRMESPPTMNDPCRNCGAWPKWDALTPRQMHNLGLLRPGWAPSGAMKTPVFPDHHLDVGEDEVVDMGATTVDVDTAAEDAEAAIVAWTSADTQIPDTHLYKCKNCGKDITFFPSPGYPCPECGAMPFTPEKSVPEYNEPGVMVVDCGPEGEVTLVTGPEDTKAAFGTVEKYRCKNCRHELVFMPQMGKPCPACEAMPFTLDRGPDTNPEEDLPTWTINVVDMGWIPVKEPHVIRKGILRFKIPKEAKVEDPEHKGRRIRSLLNMVDVLKPTGDGKVWGHVEISAPKEDDTAVFHHVMVTNMVTPPGSGWVTVEAICRSWWNPGWITVVD